MFKDVSTRPDLPGLEKEILSFWKTQKIRQRSISQRHGAPDYVFYEGPPTANGKPGVHHVLARAFKDLFPRYKAMRGYHVIRRGGWDTHGLPVEIQVEKGLGFTHKRQIEAYGIDRFNRLCRSSVFAFIQDWEMLTDRIAFWVDMEDAFVTYTNDYIESVWWILKTLWDRNLVARGFKVVPYCPRCGTPLSDHEVALGYSEVDDPSVLIRLPLVDDPETSLLIWTTTPWTLPGNVAVAVHPEDVYVTVERLTPEGGTERLILARKRLEAVFPGEKPRIIETYKGKRLKGKRYQPLFTFLPMDRQAFFIIGAEFVSTDDGSGLVHLAPAFGSEDLEAAEKYDLPILVPVDSDGTFISDVSPWRGLTVKEADPLILQDLLARGLLFWAGTYTHTYPFCWRCDTPLIYYARTTWYLRTSSFKEKMVELNEQINWYPAHLKKGRFGNWLATNVDWAIGRERYWGTPLPVWTCQDCQADLCIGSVDELSRYANRDLSDLDLHRPYIDQVFLPCEKCGGTMQRVKELIDVWFDSGAMPVAQWHYPFENMGVFETQFPADYICEAVDQTRGWFYALHAIGTLLFERVVYRNVIALGLILDNQGKKMSTSRGNVVDPWDVLNIHGADALRWYLYAASHPGQERRFSVDLVGQVVRNLTLPLWNVYVFFVTYANLVGWQPHMSDPLDYAPLDIWIRSEIQVLLREVTLALENYDAFTAARLIQGFVNHLSKWYVRRSRRRFMGTNQTEDQQAAYATLYEILVLVCHILAPMMPFLSEEIYQNLVCSVHTEAPASIHLSDWPRVNEAFLNEQKNHEMRMLMKLASLGHAARESAGINVRQPLAEAAFLIGKVADAHVIEEYQDLLAEELNVKRVRPLRSEGEVVTYGLNPSPQLLGKKYKSRFPAIRQALLALDTEDAVKRVLAGQSLEIEVGGERLSISPQEVRISAVARPGVVYKSEGSLLVALNIDFSPELVNEGLAREFVRRVQDLRKQAGFAFLDQVRLYCEGSMRLQLAIQDQQTYILRETRAVEILMTPPVLTAHSTSTTIDKKSVIIGVEKIAEDH